MSGFDIKLEPKSITGSLVVGGMFFLWTGYVLDIGGLVESGDRFFWMGIALLIYHLDKYNKKPVNKRPPVRRIRR